MRPEEQIRVFLERRAGGIVVVPVHNLLTSWRIQEAGPLDLERIAEALDSAGIVVRPRLRGLEPNSMVELRLAPPDTGRVRRRRRAVGGIAALAAVVVALLSVVPGGDGDRGGPGDVVDRKLAEAGRFCLGPAGERLVASSTGRLDDPAVLRRASAATVEIAADAPEQATCAARALEIMRDAWQAGAGSPGFEDAGRQLDRIRTVQALRGLRPGA